jgi:hypothetical protein
MKGLDHDGVPKPPGWGQVRAAPGSQGGGAKRHHHGSEAEPNSKDQPRSRVEQGSHQHRDRRRGQGAQERDQCSDIEVLDAVDISHESVQQISAVNAWKAAWHQWLQVFEGEDSHSGEHPKREIVTGQTLTVASGTSQKRERLHGRDGDAQRQHRWTESRSGDQPGGAGQEAHRRELAHQSQGNSLAGPLAFQACREQ